MTVDSAPLSARRAQTCERLLDAATQLFAERGVGAATVEEICERAGFTRGAFYSNFSSREDLCLAWLRRDHSHAIDATREVLTTMRPLADAMPVEEWVAQTIATFVGASSSTHDTVLARMELRLHAARTPEIRKEYSELTASAQQALLDLIQEALAERGWSFRIDPTLGINSLLSAYNQQSIEDMITDAGHDVTGTLLAILDVIIDKPDNSPHAQ